ncbi:phosphate ABC transporter permease subunit PstC [Rhizobium glycinendophyticum]|uniref:Phosphate transport system permease protein n=1 Tax=Rhizobium glycinendophyticum TaxID=2589807 RepID=A0A504USM3_9HYPH|nr:phosphate ABC transporter permease subunit PstC [Rhizobium glycinendophyticum]TPP09721.1 phosphate ABC transporter permease subunit PstC [Rhizobium glycinendophyticum]
MDVSIIILGVLALAAIGYALGRRRAMSLSAERGRKLHSLPGFYGQTVALITAVPALILLMLWLTLQHPIIDGRISGMITDASVPEGGAHSLVMADVRRIGDGLAVLREADAKAGADVDIKALDADNIRSRLAGAGIALGADVPAEVFEAAKAYRADIDFSQLLMTIAVLALAIGALPLAYIRIDPELRARNISESFVKAILMISSLVAIMTTVGIVGSLVVETYVFFTIYPAQDFFFSTVWNPQFRGGSDLGILPLLWGTFYVSLISLIIAVPIGLMIAVFLSEYAGPKTRSIVKPAIEMLAGIPTIVYGLFALVTVGPFLRDWLAQPLGLGSSSSSVLTAGLVMGVMIIPFVSSLSDDIINAVPQALRDGSYALGSTQSETIKQVVLPAALPGIVGAVLLAASRAIGETMIVVLGAGASAKLDLNPFEAMTTVTVKIVSQLTGDTEFASPETLVAFALGLTLFVITLLLNVIALYIVRKYREQYE